MQTEIRQKLHEAAESSYRDFSARLLPGIDRIMGVRLPVLRYWAKRIAVGSWRDYLDFKPEYFEEIMLQGMVIGYVEIKAADKVALIERFLPQIDNWSICDSFCCGLKFTVNHQALLWDLVRGCCVDQRTYYARFGVVMLLSYYIDETYIDEVLLLLGRVQADDYYAKMAVAWAISVCYVKFPEKTLVFLQASKLDKFTHQKSLQKILESRRLSKEAKQVVRQLRS